MGSAQRLGPVFRTWAQPDSTRTQAPKEIQVVTDPGSYHLTFSTFCAAKSLAATVDTKMWKVKTSDGSFVCITPENWYMNILLCC